MKRKEANHSHVLKLFEKIQVSDIQNTVFIPHVQDFKIWTRKLNRQNAFKSTRCPSEFVLIMSSKKTAGELNPTTATKEMFTQTLTSISTGVFRCDDISRL